MAPPQCSEKNVKLDQKHVVRREACCDLGMTSHVHCKGHTLKTANSVRGLEATFSDRPRRRATRFHWQIQVQYYLACKFTGEYEGWAKCGYLGILVLGVDWRVPQHSKQSSIHVPLAKEQSRSGCSLTLSCWNDDYYLHQHHIWSKMYSIR